ncbi:hypothetical protein CANMA_002334 [Candida margitis]|uniref:uncharacterized protein n=1 Tax=Candida margitis TaxID=1775924 RepID=UPI0022276FCC|nr:uncharacterized protein CANMA_002334 [Candida margitis]KAI5968589.1 hypothetical protein CANMA_002334 [Candida margitis]
MPPKKAKKAAITILKLKNGKLTYLLTLSTITLDNIRQDLALAINKSGGIPSQDAEAEIKKQEEEIEEDIIDEDNIPVPKSEFEVIEDVGGGDAHQVDSDDLRIAIPRNESSPYDSEWIELSDDTIDEVEFKDYDILAFATAPDEKFAIVEAAYED